MADITYIPTAAGFLYLAVILDAWSRKVVGRSMASHLRTTLVLEALEMALGRRNNPAPAPFRSATSRRLREEVCSHELSRRLKSQR